MTNIKKEIIEVVKACDFAILSTLNLRNFPETRAVSNVLNRNLDERLDIYFASRKNTSKYEQIAKNYNSSLYYFSHGKRNMTLFGRLEEATDENLKNRLWNDEFSPHYQNGREDALYGILQFIPYEYKYYVYTSNGIPQKIEGKL